MEERILIGAAEVFNILNELGWHGMTERCELTDLDEDIDAGIRLIECARHGRLKEN